MVFQVIECNAYHFLKGANIQNPTKRLFLIPVNGTPTLVPDCPLSQCSCYFFDDSRTLLGEEIDIITLVLGKMKE